MKARILDFIDFKRVNTLLDGFNQSTGFVTAILDLDGNILSGSGWRRMCTDYHRMNPETAKKCTISDTILANKMRKGEIFQFYKCMNGLVDVAVPIIIRGEHIANLFSGQFLFEKPNLSFFKNQAKQYGFEEKAYLETLDEIPVISEGKAIAVMNFLQNITRMIIEITYEKMELIELNESKKKAEDRLLYLSNHDHLTDLYNRRFFEEEMTRIDTKENRPISIIMGDLNGLKLINDSFGHNTGDVLLKKAAETLTKACSNDGIIARLGGDEFAVLLPKTDTDKTQQIIACIKDLALNEKISNISLSISLGRDTKEKEEQSILETLVNAENDMYRHKVYERLSMRSKMIDIIMNTLFEKSDREMMHSKRVSGMSEAIAVKMNLDKEKVGQIRIAGLVHDIGKIGIDEKILNKIEKPNNDEWKKIREHPEMGWRILSTTREFSELASVVIAHHEKWDGSGYPNRLKGEEIPLEARIIAVADAFDAMTNQRSYRKPLSKKAAVNELINCSGIQFDCRVVDVFLKQVLI